MRSTLRRATSLLAHYPQDLVVLETADRLGLLVWEELPVVREISTSKEFANNCKVMLTEMIRQHYNHPSIIMWCLMNEVFLKMRYEAGYVRQVVALARTLEYKQWYKVFCQPQRITSFQIKPSSDLSRASIRRLFNSSLLLTSWGFLSALSLSHRNILGTIVVNTLV